MAMDGVVHRGERDERIDESEFERPSGIATARSRGSDRHACGGRGIGPETASGYESGSARAEIAP